MKKIKFFVLLVVVMLFTACHDKLWDSIEDLDSRVTKLEELCKEMNTNISALQTIVEVIQENDFITGIVPIEKGGEVIGYTIMFGKHEPITIYNGEDGKDGQDGSGSTPIIGVAKDTDGVYYWTLNGEWLFDAEGNKLPVSGKNGSDGADGENGGSNDSGLNGQDGVTPQLKIENGYWYVSYDNGATWTELGKAVGEDGKDGVNGTDGKDGQDGDSMFTSVTYDDNNVYFTLTDGSVLIVPLGSRKEQVVQIIDGAIMAEFSVSETKKVYFSKGNLQYIPEGTHKCADGTTQPGTWLFVDNQWEEGSYLYMGNSGYEYNVEIPTDSKESKSGIKFDFYRTCTNISKTYYDWGEYNAIQNGGDMPSVYRLLTNEEWDYLLNKRSNANQLKGEIYIDNIKGLYLLPDSWEYLGSQLPNVVYSKESQIFEQFIPFDDLEKKGVVFLFSEVNYATTSMATNKNSYGTSYYTSTVLWNGILRDVCIARANGTHSASGADLYQYTLKVRLVKDVE